jgi:hypothetical protein
MANHPKIEGVIHDVDEVPEGTLWKTAWVVCRICGHRHVSVYPLVDELDECALQCPNCEHMTCEPDEEDDE